MIGGGETSGSSWGSAYWDLDRSHSGPSTHGLYSNAVENSFQANPYEIGERLLGWAMTFKDFFTSSEDQQDRMEQSITWRKWLFAGNTWLIIDCETATREEAKEQAIDRGEMDRIHHGIDRQVLHSLSQQQFPRSIKKESP
ncbi:hypothetical protein B9Z19DRAFT_1122625 [Tuber borchii]|uniref:Uncharacterized protein n=1 Tax=Tuber borchii TaxID=42251 RepID=A0A2T7A023_TUBBO|nr:hypothetical protein B9Z19DRAFT_1122625 [Tuber borchii]